MSENQKKVWVTGASSGIGKAVAEKFAKEGEVLKHWLLIKLDLISKDKRRTLSK